MQPQNIPVNAYLALVFRMITYFIKKPILSLFAFPVFFLSCGQKKNEGKQNGLNTRELVARVQTCQGQPASQVVSGQAIVSEMGKFFSCDSTALVYFLSLKKTVAADTVMTESLVKKLRGIEYTNPVHKASLLKMSLDIFQESGNYKALYELNSELRNLYFLKNQVSTAMYYAKKKYNCAQKLGVHKKLDALFDIGSLYHKLRNIDSARIYLHKADQQLHNVEEGSQKNFYYNTLADFYRELNDLRKAISYHMLVVKKEKHPDSWTYTSLGKCYLRMNMVDSAIYCFKKVIEPGGPKWAKILRIVAHCKLALCYSEKNDMSKAFNYAKLARSMADSLRDVETKIQAYKTLYEIARKVKNEKVALENLELLNKANEELNNDNGIRQQTSYEFKLREETQEAAQKKRELILKERNARVDQQLKQRNVLVALAAGVLLLISVLLILNIRNSRRVKKQNILIEKSLKEKEMLLREIHHRVKNNLQIINSLLNMQMSRDDGKTTKEVIKLSQDRIHAMAIIHEKLYRSVNLEDISMREYLESMCQYYNTSYDFSAKNIHVNIQANVNHIHIDQLIPLGLIVNELLINSVKYAFDEKGGTIDITCNQSGDLIIFTMADNGKGLPEAYEQKMKKSLGIQLVQGLARQLKARLRIENKPGAHFTLEFKRE